MQGYSNLPFRQFHHFPSLPPVSRTLPYMVHLWYATAVRTDLPKDRKWRVPTATNSVTSSLYLDENFYYFSEHLPETCVFTTWECRDLCFSIELYLSSLPYYPRSSRPCPNKLSLAKSPHQMELSLLAVINFGFKCLSSLLTSDLL